SILLDPPVHYGLGEYYYRGRPALGSTDQSRMFDPNQILRKASEPRMVGLYAAGAAAGGLLMAISEMSRGPKGHHGATGRAGRILLGLSVAVGGAVLATVSWQNQALV